jgi:hypothetical protein
LPFLNFGIKPVSPILTSTSVFFSTIQTTLTTAVVSSCIPLAQSNVIVTVTSTAAVASFSYAQIVVMKTLSLAGAGQL